MTGNRPTYLQVVAKNPKADVWTSAGSLMKPPASNRVCRECLASTHGNPIPDSPSPTQKSASHRIHFREYGFKQVLPSLGGGLCTSPTATWQCLAKVAARFVCDEAGNQQTIPAELASSTLVDQVLLPTSHQNEVFWGFTVVLVCFLMRRRKTNWRSTSWQTKSSN